MDDKKILQDEVSKNIFDDFSTDSTLLEEVNKLKEEQKKDTFYYLSIVSKVFQNIFILLLIILIFSYGYIYIQKNENISDSALLDPICFAFKSSWLPLPSSNTYCSSISYIKQYYNSQIELKKQEHSKKILENLVKIYEQENFDKTKEMIFLTNKSNYSTSILAIFEKFNWLKNDFSWIDKSKIQCDSLEINFDNKLLNMKCYSFSQWYERWIIWFSWKKNYDEIWWTSISIANSFLNFIEKNSSDFSIVNRQKIFSSEGVVGESNWYTNKTPFDLTLKINF